MKSDSPTFWKERFTENLYKVCEGRKFKVKNDEVAPSSKDPIQVLLERKHDINKEIPSLSRSLGERTKPTQSFVEMLVDCSTTEDNLGDKVFNELNARLPKMVKARSFVFVSLQPFVLKKLF